MPQSNIRPSAPEHIERLLTLARAKSFLGHEFLAWLWFQSESTDASLTVTNPFGKGQLKAHFWIDDHIILESSSGEIHMMTLKGGQPSASPEAGRGLASGKNIRELRLGLEIQGLGEISAVLPGETLAPRALKLPDLGESEDQSAKTTKLATPVAARLAMADLFVNFIDQLFAQFLEERLDDDWNKKGYSAMKKWLRSRRGEANEVLH